jgi:alkylation response protein AidB-like acyl-CoA dehydrogenase
MRGQIAGELAVIAAAPAAERARLLAAGGWVAPHMPRPWGRDASPLEQLVIAEEMRAARLHPPGLGIGAWVVPALVQYGTAEQQQRFLPATLSGETVWCQLFSEPGAGSDLAGLATRAVHQDGPDGGQWVVDGQKVWTSVAHHEQWGLLLARTDPDVPKHAGLTYFGLDMQQPGVEVRPLRQLTGEAEFNEVFLTDAAVPDTDQIGGIGEGWRVAQATLMNERIAIGGGAIPREGGMAGLAAAAWREHPEARTPGLHDRLIRLWADAEVARLAGARLRQQLAAGTPGPEGSAAKIVFARLNQELSAFELELAGAAGLTYDDWTLRRPESLSFFGRGPGYRYLRSRGNSIEGGTSEILRNIIAERVLGLPAEPRTDTKVAWKDLPR